LRLVPFMDLFLNQCSRHFVSPQILKNLKTPYALSWPPNKYVAELMMTRLCCWLPADPSRSHDFDSLRSIWPNYYARPKDRRWRGRGRFEIIGSGSCRLADCNSSQFQRGQIVGFKMPRIKGFKEIHTLYSPAHRKTTFPNADWKFLIHAAANCAASFHVFHKAKIGYWRCK